MGPPAPFVEGEGLRETIPDIEWLWRNSADIFDAFLRLPLTRCHFDFWPPNLFATYRNGSPETVAIDLGYVGIGYMGHDAANLVADSVLDFFIDAENAMSAWQSVVSSYLESLGESLNECDLRRVEYGMRLTVALKYAWVLPATFQVARNHDSLNKIERDHGNIKEFFDKRCAALRFIGGFVKSAEKTLSLLAKD